MKLYERFRSIIKKNQVQHICAVALAMLLITGALIGCAPTSQAPGIDHIANPAATVQTPALYDEDVVTSIYERAVPAVVTISATVESRGRPFHFGPSPPMPEKHQGSGFIIDEEGHILTNYHVIEGVSTVKVTLYDDRTLDAQVVGTDPQDDLALLKVDPSKVGDIMPLPLGDSDAVKPGQMAIALGAPFGLGGSITVGVISGVGRALRDVTGREITDVLQTDAAINPGNSGGPLLNSKGEVIGINTAIESPDSGAYGIGFAVPINTAKSVLPSLLKGEDIGGRKVEEGKTGRAWLGIEGQTVTTELAKALNLVVEYGAYVVEVIAGSPANRAGLTKGDVITAVDGETITSMEDLVDYLNSKKPGDNVSLTAYRGNPSMLMFITVTVALGERPGGTPS